MAQTSTVCIVGGGISGAALALSFAKAQQQQGGPTRWEVTVMHDEQDLGGHASSYPVEYQGTTYNIDLGVQMIAPVMYPNTMCMLEFPEFAAIKAAMQPVELAISAAFAPETPNGPAPYWGNLAPYQTTPLAQSGTADCLAFDQLLEAHPYSLMTLATYLADHQSVFTGGSSAHFETYFLDPLLSILNGYSSPLTNQLLAPEIAFVFDHNLASFEHPTTGFQRFGSGAAAFPRQMGEWASSQAGVTTMPYTCVDQVSPTVGGPVTITYHSTQPGGDPSPKHTQFDHVVIAVDQYHAGKLLDQSPLWASHYSQYVGQDVWNLYSQWSYLHTDRTILAPGLPNPPQETLQYNEYFGADHGYATYIAANVVGLGPEHFDAFPYMVSMYAFDPASVSIPGFHVPDPIVAQPPQWYHGMWLPSFFWDEKRAFHTAQGVSTNPAVPARPGQLDTHVYFAGNNLTMDSAEGALLAAMVLGHYAFDLPVIETITGGTNVGTGRSVLALLAYTAFYELMFPGFQNGVSTIAHQMQALDAIR